MALSNVGGSITALEKALDTIASQPAKGPKSAVVHDVLDKLLSYDRLGTYCLNRGRCCLFLPSCLQASASYPFLSSFISFADMMTRAAEADFDYDDPPSFRNDNRATPPSGNSDRRNRVANKDDDGDEDAEGDHVEVGYTHKNTLVSMGFEADLVDVILGNQMRGSEASLEQLVMILSEMTVGRMIFLLLFLVIINIFLSNR